MKLTLQFDRTVAFEIATQIYDNANIEAEFVDEVLIKEITENFSPDDIFSEQVLIDWAVDHDRDQGGGRMNIEPIKPSEISCRNCKRFTDGYNCWKTVKDFGHECKLCKVKEVQNER